METEILDNIETNSVYIHLDTGNLYYVKILTKMKHPDNGKWIDCVIYQSAKDNKVWVRSLDNFKTYFKLVM